MENDLLIDSDGNILINEYIDSPSSIDKRTIIRLTIISGPNSIYRVYIEETDGGESEIELDETINGLTNAENRFKELVKPFVI